MENNFEQRRDGAHCVAKVDMCCLVFQTLIIIATILVMLFAFSDRLPHISNDVWVFIILLACILILIIAVDFYAIKRLLKATSENNNLSAEKALSWSRFWFNLSIFFLVIGIFGELITFQPKSIFVLAVGVPIRVSMLAKVKSYMDALKERVTGTGATVRVNDPSIVEDDVV